MSVGNSNIHVDQNKSCMTRPLRLVSAWVVKGWKVEVINNLPLGYTGYPLLLEKIIRSVLGSYLVEIRTIRREHLSFTRLMVFFSPSKVLDFHTANFAAGNASAISEQSTFMAEGTMTFSAYIFAFP